MLIGTKEHYVMMEFFEQHVAEGRIDREDNKYWKAGNFYQNGDVNKAFLAFQNGVAYGRSVYLLEQ